MIFNGIKLGNTYFYLGLITTPKDQGQCGSCAAFAAGSIVETCLKVAAGGNLNTYDISEQFLLDCAYEKPNKLEGPAGIKYKFCISNSLKIFGTVLLEYETLIIWNQVVMVPLLKLIQNGL